MTIYQGFIGLIGGASTDLDSWDGATLVGGEVASVFENGKISHYKNIQNSATVNGIYIFAPATNPGTNRWHLLVPQGAMSHVMATGGVQTFNSGTTEKMEITSISKDLLDEYDGPSATFRPKYTGTYLTTIDFLSENGISLGGGTDYILVTPYVTPPPYTTPAAYSQSFGRLGSDHAVTRVPYHRSLSIDLTAAHDMDIRMLFNFQTADSLLMSVTIDRLI